MPGSSYEELLTVAIDPIYGASATARDEAHELDTAELETRRGSPDGPDVRDRDLAPGDGVPAAHAHDGCTPLRLALTAGYLEIARSHITQA